MSEKQVWDAACDVREGSEVVVVYDSFRSNNVQSMEGRVTGVMAREDRCKIEALRDDGQRITIEDDGILYSPGSHYPRTGEIEQVEVVNDPSKVPVVTD